MTDFDDGPNFSINRRQVLPDGRLLLTCYTSDTPPNTFYITLNKPVAEVLWPVLQHYVNGTLPEDSGDPLTRKH